MITVEPKAFTGYNMSIAQLWGSGPKFKINCGNCSITFKQRIPMVDSPGVKCPNCGVVNVLELTVGKKGEE